MATPSSSSVTLVTPGRDPSSARVKLTASGLVHNLLAQVSKTFIASISITKMIVYQRQITFPARGILVMASAVL